MQVTAKKRSNAFRKTPGERIFDFINGFILVLLCIVTLYPMWYVIVASFTENSYLVAHPGTILWPVGFTVGSYELAFTHPLLVSGYLNILFVLVVSLPINILLTKMGFQPIYFLGQPSTFVPTIIATGIWQSIGWGSIIYLAAISGISPELYESALLDGANRLQRIWYITLPSIAPTIVVLFILNMGSILNGGFDQIFNLYNDAVMSVADILDTYVYRRGLTGLQYSYAAAVGLFKNGIGFLFVFATNLFARKLGDASLW